MVEVLVSIVLLSIGVLGAAGLQLAAIRATQQSAYQTIAFQLASDIADTLHAFAADEVPLPEAASMLDLDYTSVPGAPNAASGTCYFTSCGLSELANSEISEWKMRLATSFPTARLRICRDTNPWNEAGQVYKWDCDGEGAEAPLVIKLGWKVKNPDGSYVKGGEDGFPPSVVVPVAAT